MPWMNPSIGFDGSGALVGAGVAVATATAAAAGEPNGFGNDGNGTGTGMIIGFFFNFLRMAAVFTILAILATLSALAAFAATTPMANFALAILNGSVMIFFATSFAAFACEIFWKRKEKTSQ